MITRRALLSLAAGSLISPLALTCNSAPERGSLEKQVLRAHRKASTVVLARVIEAGFQNSFSHIGEPPTHRAKVEVLESWKGNREPGSTLQTTMPTSIGACGMVLTPGETYLLYLHDKEPFDLSLSRRGARLVDASAEIGILRSHFGKTSS